MSCPTTHALPDEFAYVNDVAEAYDESAFDQRMRDYMMRTFAPHLLPGRALQMGCFHGDFTQELASRYQDLSVVDAAQTFLDHTRRRIGPTLITHHSLFETFTPPHPYEAIFIIHVLEHLQDPVAVLAQARQMLSPGGRLYLAVPNGQAVSRMIAVQMGLLEAMAALTPADIKHGHRRVYFLDTLEADVRKAGLRIIDSGGIFFKPLANFQFDKLLSPEHSGIISNDFMDACFRLGRQYPHFCASVYAVAEAL
jgi:2-polyprenyl-3-methyl-5-hydroxy-6-metoxy-1,4-benzoquinol methylase